jgi:hypothetical protein
MSPALQTILFRLHRLQDNLELIDANGKARLIEKLRQHESENPKLVHSWIKFLENLKVK